MPFTSDLPRLAVAVIATAVVVYRMGPRVLAAVRSKEKSWVEALTAMTAMLAFVGALWGGFCMTLENSEHLLWPGIALAFTASSACLILLGIVGIRARQLQTYLPPDIRAAARSSAHGSAPLTSVRLALAMLTILGASGAIGAARLDAGSLEAPLAMLGAGGLITLMIIEFRRGWSGVS